jgi:hypothetical protein
MVCFLFFLLTTGKGEIFVKIKEEAKNVDARKEKSHHANPSL